MFVGLGLDSSPSPRSPPWIITKPAQADEEETPRSKRLSSVAMDEVMEQVGPIKEPSPAYSFNYEELKKSVGDLPKGVDPSKKEQYLSDADFEKASNAPHVDLEPCPRSELTQASPRVGSRLAARRVCQAQTVEAAAAQEGRRALLGPIDSRTRLPVALGCSTSFGRSE